MGECTGKGAATSGRLCATGGPDEAAPRDNDDTGNTTATAEGSIDDRSNGDATEKGWRQIRRRVGRRALAGLYESGRLRRQEPKLEGTHLLAFCLWHDFCPIRPRRCWGRIKDIGLAPTGPGRC